MSDNLDKLKGHSDVKQDINRRKPSDVKGKEGLRLNKRINDISKVISDPDVWNVNISSRDRMDKMEQRVEELERRMNGMAHIMRSIAFNRRLVEEDIQAIEDRVDDDNHISGSSE